MGKKRQSDKATYELAKPYLYSASSLLLASGRDIRGLGTFVQERVGDALAPYAKRFIKDVREGVLTVPNHHVSSKDAALERRITPAQRETMIREAAYFLAEKRGFAGAPPEDDWYSAERDIKRQLAREFATAEPQSHEHPVSLNNPAGRRFRELEDTLRHRLEDAGAAGKKPGKKKARKAKSRKDSKPATPHEVTSESQQSEKKGGKGSRKKKTKKGKKNGKD
jgi:hypothetical protein